jgi:membrane-associated protease RseP (regulator of RpoE activity)
MIDFYTLSVIAFILVLIALLYRDRKNIKREGVAFLRRTEKGKPTIIRIGLKFPRFWKALGMLGVFAGFYFSIVGFLLMLQLTVTNLVAKKAAQGLALLLPSPTSETIIAPGIFAPPFWYFIISIALLIVVHEGMHGIMAAREKIKIKHLGLILLAVIPGAFVDIDEKQLRKEKHWKQMRIFAAGSFGNFILAFFSAALLIGLAASTQIPAGVSFSGYVANYSAQTTNLTGTIISIENYSIKNIADMESALRAVGPNRTIAITTLINNSETLAYILDTTGEPWPAFAPNILTDAGLFLEQNIPGSMDFFEAANNAYRTFTGMKEQSSEENTIRQKILFWNYAKDSYPALYGKADLETKQLEARLQNFSAKGFIGIAGPYNAVEIKPGLELFSGAVDFISGLLGFLFLINFGVGIVNLLPLWVTDGARMWELVFMRVSKRRYKSILQVVSYIVLLMILMNFILPYKPF